MANNWLLKRVEYSNATNFTTDLGMKIRSKIYKPLQVPLRLATKGKIILESLWIRDNNSFLKVEKNLDFLNLTKHEPYIFISNHSFNEDLNAALAILDRNAYLLIGSTDQIEHNIQAHAVWLQGMVYVNRLDADSRRESVKKMCRLLEAGTSVLIFLEGVYNNTENLLVEQIYNSPYVLAQMTGCKIVPLASFRESDSSNIYITAMPPISLEGYSKEESKVLLRDTLATMVFELWYHHSKHISRKDLNEKMHLQYMEERRREYLKVPWTRDVWDEEIVEYYDPLYPRPEQVWKTLEDVKVTERNAAIMGPILVKNDYYKRYNFKEYMHNNWDK